MYLFVCYISASRAPFVVSVSLLRLPANFSVISSAFRGLPNQHVRRAASARGGNSPGGGRYSASSRCDRQPLQAVGKRCGFRFFQAVGVGGRSVKGDIP